MGAGCPGTKHTIVTNHSIARVSTSAVELQKKIQIVWLGTSETPGNNDCLQLLRQLYGYHMVSSYTQISDFLESIEITNDEIIIVVVSCEHGDKELVDTILPRLGNLPQIHSIFAYMSTPNTNQYSVVTQKIYSKSHLTTTIDRTLKLLDGKSIIPMKEQDITITVRESSINALFNALKAFSFGITIMGNDGIKTIMSVTVSDLQISLHNGFAEFNAKVKIKKPSISETVSGEAVVVFDQENKCFIKTSKGILHIKHLSMKKDVDITEQFPLFSLESLINLPPKTLPMPDMVECKTLTIGIRNPNACIKEKQLQVSFDIDQK